MKPTEPLDRPRNCVLKEVIAQYVAYHEVLVDKIKAGIEQADAGDLVAHNDVVKRQVKRKKRQA